MFLVLKTITVEFGCSKADRTKMSADPSADIMFAYTYMIPGKQKIIVSKPFVSNKFDIFMQQSSSHKICPLSLDGEPTPFH